MPCTPLALGLAEEYPVGPFDTQVNILSHDVSNTLAPLLCFILMNWLPRAFPAHMALASSPILTVPKLLHSMTFPHYLKRQLLDQHHTHGIDKKVEHHAPFRRFSHSNRQSAFSIRTFASPMLAPSNANFYASCCISFLNEYSNRMLKMHLIICKRQAPIGENYKNTSSRLLLPIQVAVHAKMERAAADFGINFSGLPTCNVKSRIPGHHTIARAEAYGVLTTLMMVQSNID
jgi:hypothetical protein